MIQKFKMIDLHLPFLPSIFQPASIHPTCISFLIKVGMSSTFKKTKKTKKNVRPSISIFHPFDLPSIFHPSDLYLISIFFFFHPRHSFHPSHSIIQKLNNSFSHWIEKIREKLGSCIPYHFPSISPSIRHSSHASHSKIQKIFFFSNFEITELSVYELERLETMNKKIMEAPSTTLCEQFFFYNFTKLNDLCLLKHVPFFLLYALNRM